MGDAARKFEVKIVSTYDPQGNQQAAQGLQEVGKATEKAGEHAEEFNRGGREMHRLFGELNRLTPGLGEALKGIFEPQALGIIGAVMLVEAFTKALERQKEIEREKREQAAAVWAAEQEGAESATKSAENFEQAMRAAVDVSEDMKKSLAGEQTILDALIGAHKKLLDALENEQLAAAGGDKAKEESVKHRFADLKREYDLTAESMKLEKQRDDLTQRQFQARPRLQAAALQAEADLEEEKDNRAAADAAGRNEGKDAKKLKLAADEAPAQVRNAQSILEQLTREHGANSPEADRARRLLDEAQQPIKDFAAYQRDVETVSRHTKTVEALNKAKEDAVKVYQENESAIKQESEAVKTGESVLNIHRQTAQSEKVFGDVAQVGGVSAIPGLIESAAGNMQLVQQHQKLSSSQIEINQTASQLLSDVGFSNQAIQRILNSLANNQQGMKGFLADLERRIRDVESRPIMRGSVTGQ